MPLFASPNLIPIYGSFRQTFRANWTDASFLYGSSPPENVINAQFPLAVHSPDDGAVVSVEAIASNPRNTIADKTVLSHGVAESPVSHELGLAVARRDRPANVTAKSSRQTRSKTSKSVDDFHVDLPASLDLVDGQH